MEEGLLSSCRFYLVNQETLQHVLQLLRLVVIMPQRHWPLLPRDYLTLPSELRNCYPPVAVAVWLSLNGKTTWFEVRYCSVSDFMGEFFGVGRLSSLKILKAPVLLRPCTGPQ